MLLAILAVLVFQSYWLQKNYKEEEKVLGIRANTLFREAVGIEQLKLLKLDTSIKWNIKEGHPVRPKEIIESEIQEAALSRPKSATGVIISVNKTDFRSDSTEFVPKGTDSITQTVRLFKRPGGQALIQLIGGVDSLKNAVTIKDIKLSFDSLLQKENMSFSYTISKKPGEFLETLPFESSSNTNEVTIGFFNPITYVLELTSINKFILKRLTIPILISLFLVGLTITSFLLMWRSLRQQKRLAALKNEFVSNITHELKTPIATVGVAIEALKNFNAINDPKRTKEYLDISSSEIHRLGLLVDKVLKLSLFENKAITLQKEKFDLMDLVQDVLASMKLQFEKHEAAVTFESIGDNFLIEADKLHITSVLYNLLDNALKYSKGKPTIDVLIKSHQEHVSISVTDNGVGISKEYKNKIFEKFFRIPGGDQHNIKGYGLGLSYVSHIVKKHMGYVDVRSELGKGSTFIVNIPYKEADKIKFDDFRTIRKESV